MSRATGIRAGELRHSITFRQNTATTSDGYGQETVTGGVFAENVPAKIQPTAGMERMLGPQLVAQTSHLITMRYLPGVTADMWIQFGTRRFDINAIVNVEERNIKHEL